MGLVNLLTTTRVQRKGFDTSLVLYGPGVLMASGTRGFPKVGDEAFPGHMAINNQIRTFLDEGGTVYACRFACGALYGFPEDFLMEGVDAVPSARRARRRADRVARPRLPAQHLDGVATGDAVPVREDAVAAWRRAEARVYPTVMVDATIYEQYLTMVRAVADELADVRTEDELVDGLGGAPRARAARSSPRHAPSMRAFMDLEAVRDAAFCHRHREHHARARQGDRRASASSRRGASGPSGSCSSTTSRRWARTAWRCTSRTGRALHASCKRAARPRRPTLLAGGRPARSGHGHVAAGQAAAHAGPDLPHARRVGGAHRPGAGDVRKGLTMVTTHPQRIIDAHCHIGEIPPWKFYDLEHPVKPTVYDYRSTRRSS